MICYVEVGLFSCSSCRPSSRMFSMRRRVHGCRPSKYLYHLLVRSKRMPFESDLFGDEAVDHIILWESLVLLVCIK